MSEKFNENKDGKNEAGSLQTSGSGDNGMTTPSSEKPGWQFAGWYIDPECTKRINPGGKIPEMTSLYPKWVPIVYPVLYELEEGENSPYNPEAVSALSGIVKLYPAVSSGRQFAGWYWKGKKVDYLPEGIAEPVMLKAEFRDPVRIHFASGKGSRMDAKFCTESGRLENPPVPLRIGYTFTGWFLDAGLRRPWNEDTVFEEDGVLYAGWERTEYPVILDPDQGMFNGPVIQKYTVETPSFLLPVPVRPGWRFEGWYTQRGLPAVMVRKGTIGGQFFKARWSQETPQIVQV